MPCSRTQHGLTLQIKEVEGLYYLCSKNKGADQLRSYCAADLYLSFRIYKKQVFSCCGSFNVLFVAQNKVKNRELF